MPAHRLLIYSHDSFGLGHLRRCRSIALALVERFPNLEARIVSGLPLVAEFGYHPRISLTLVPPVIKLKNGDYRARKAGQGLVDAIEERSRIICDTARAFEPDVFLVDKEPLGIRGEVRATLDELKRNGVPCVLGLRDVMDDPPRLVEEWQRKGAIEALDTAYDEIWIYGLPRIYEPLAGVPLAPHVRRKIVYTSYLYRNGIHMAAQPEGASERPYILVTPGGGGDGERLVDWVLDAIEHDPSLPHRIVIVSGPFMDGQSREAFASRVARLPQVEIITFTSDMEVLMKRASGIVAMGGYNTFCEILSFDRPALIVPRTVPRLEQFIRASRAAALGLVAMLPGDGDRNPERMAAALRRLPHQARPSSIVIPGLLDGHDAITARVSHWLGIAEPTRRLAEAAG